MSAWPSACLLLLVTGCALTQKSAPVEMRYFSPPERAATLDHVPGQHTPLRLGRIVASSLLGTRIVHRDSSVELVPYETLRWSDEPEVYVRRALVRAMFDDRPFVQATDGTTPTLDIDLIGFEEVRRDGRKFGRVELHYALRDDNRVLARGSVVVERPAGTDITSVVAAIGNALEAASEELAARVTDVVASRR